MYRMGLGDPPQDDCPAGMSLFGNPPTCVSDAIAGQAPANIMGAQGTCPPGFILEGTGPTFCSPEGASPSSPCDFGNVYINGSCYPVGSTQSGNVVTLPDGTQVDSSTGEVIGSYDWIVSHGGGGTVSTGPAPPPSVNTSPAAIPPASVSSPAHAAPPATQSSPASAAPIITLPPLVNGQLPSNLPNNQITLPPASGGFSLSSIPWWGYAIAAGVAVMAFKS